MTAVVALERTAPWRSATARATRFACSCWTSTPSTTTATTTRFANPLSGSSSTTSGPPLRAGDHEGHGTWGLGRVRAVNARFAAAIGGGHRGRRRTSWCTTTSCTRGPSRCGGRRGPTRAPALHARSLAGAAGLARAAERDARGDRPRRARRGHRRLPHRRATCARSSRPARPCRDVPSIAPPTPCAPTAADAGARVPHLGRPEEFDGLVASPAVLAAEESRLRARPERMILARRPHGSVEERRARLPGPRPPAGQAPGPVRPRHHARAASTRRGRTSPTTPSTWGPSSVLRARSTTATARTPGSPSICALTITSPRQSPDTSTTTFCWSTRSRTA